MTKDVLLSLKGLQFDGDNQDDITTVWPAQYYKKNGKHYLVYEEEMEDFPGTIKNVIKFQEKELDVTKKGSFNVHLLFQENQKTLASYASPFGEFMVGIDTTDIKFSEKEEKYSSKSNMTWS